MYAEGAGDDVIDWLGATEKRMNTILILLAGAIAYGIADVGLSYQSHRIRGEEIE